MIFLTIYIYIYIYIHLSELLEKNPLVPYLKSYIKDDWDFRKKKLPSHFNYNCSLYSCDIVSLYSNITHDLGLTALEYWIGKCRNNTPKRYSKQFILESAAFILINNNFKFNDTMFAQLIGTAMGTTFAPYACLAIGFLEETKLYPSLQTNLTSDLAVIITNGFLRFMDDGFIPWPNNADIDIFKTLLNDIDTRIEFTLETDDGKAAQKINFLVITIMVDEDCKVETDIFYKQTNTHDYLNYKSHHSKHIKDNIPYNLAKRIIIFCSKSETEKLGLNELRNWLLDCNFPKAIIAINIAIISNYRQENS